MTKQSLAIILSLGVGLSSCSPSGEESEQTDLSDNPFMQVSSLPYGAPDFNVIRNAHFKPALLEGMRQQTEAVQAIADNPQDPTFENTILALEKSSILLDRTDAVFSALAGAHTNDTIQAVEEALAPKMAAHSDAIYLNQALFDRIQTLYNERESLELDAESQKLLEYYYDRFKKAGAALSLEDKEKLKALNSELATLSNTFRSTLLEANNAGTLIIEDSADLAGLSTSEIQSLKVDDHWEIPLQNTTQQPLLQSLKNREIRKALYTASYDRADGPGHNTRPIIIKIAQLRAEKAALLGFDTYAEWSMQGTMAKTPQHVQDMFDQLIPAATAKAQAEAADIQKMIQKEGGRFTLEPYDWNFYAEKVKKALYDLDESQIKPYFVLDSVLENGVFYAAERLYGLTFKKRTDIPTYHPDVRVYEVFDADGSALGLFYGDYFKRDSKRGGAWMSSFVSQSHLMDQKPVIYNVCNFTKPSEGDPALLTFDEALTTFHEFGHALHGFFANQEYPSLSGTAVARDFVEFPSQFNENWATHPEILKHYAKHYKTGAVIPQALLDKLQQAATFNQGYALTENLAASNLDMQWHTLPADSVVEDAGVFEQAALHKTGLDVVHAVPPRYRSTYFSHIFGSGYAAGYYSYLWTEMLDHDAYEWFKQHGGLSRENGQRFRDMVLSLGNTQDYETMYKNWRGSDPRIEPFLKARGIAR